MNPKDQRALEHLPAAARVILWPLLAVVLIHTLMISTWVAPNNPVRQELGGDTVRAYVMPWFEQNWSIFAPNPRRVAVTFEVRAVMQDPQTQETFTTEWVDLVVGEDQEVRYNLFPSRTSGMARRTADRLHSARSDMNDAQIEGIQAHYTETPVQELEERLKDISGGAAPAQVDRYMAADEAAVALATGYAHHAWEGEVLHVQYRTSTRPAPSYANRHEQTVDDTARTERGYGWRAPAEVSDEELALFEPYAEQSGAAG